MTLRTNKPEPGDTLSAALVGDFIERSMQVDGFNVPMMPIDPAMGLTALSRTPTGIDMVPTYDGTRYNDWRNLSAFTFMGRIVDGGRDDAPNYTDERYWVAELFEGSTEDGNRGLAVLRTVLENEAELIRLGREGEVPLPGRVVTATHTGERVARTHGLPTGIDVLCWALRRKDGLHKWFFSAPVAPTRPVQEYCLLTGVEVGDRFAVRGHRMRPTEEPDAWLKAEEEEEFRTEWGIPSIHYKAFEWPSDVDPNFRATFLPIHNTGAFWYVEQKPKYALPVEPPDLNRWPRSECWLF